MYIGAKLQDMFSERLVKQTGRRMVNDGVTVFRERVREFTPVDSSRLRDSYQVGTTLSDAQGWQSRVHTDVEYAPYVEFGTGLFGPHRAKYEIKPKRPGGMLHWVDKHGKHIYARRVMHPGSPGNHMFSIGAMITERTLGLILQPALEEWAMLQEQMIRRH